MPNDADILSTLTELFGDQKRQAIVARLYRLPEIWDALRDASYLASLAEQLPAEQWLPGRITALAYGHDSLSSLAEDGLVFDGDAESLEPGSAAARLKGVAALGVQLLAMSARDDPAELAQAVRTNPEMWTTALACAWPHLMATSWVADFFPRSATTAHARMIATALLANTDVLASAQSLVSLDGERLASLLPELKNAGFDELYAALGQLSIEKLAEINQGVEHDPSPAWIAPAVLLAVSGDVEGAHQAFRRAWDRSGEASAAIADQLAEVARHEADPVLELEARRQAVESSASSIRRAALARALFELERYEDAQPVIADPESVGEKIAAGAVGAKLGDPKAAVEILLQAVRDLPEERELGDDWQCWLKNQLAELGELNAAIDVQMARCETLGTQSGMMLELADLHAKAGDPAAAASCAAVAEALDPGSLDAVQVLADSLQKSGQAQRALAHWQQIAQQKPEVWAQVSRCAIEAGDAGAALETATEALKNEPDSIEAQVLIGKAHALKGDYEAARTFLEQVVDRAPSQAEAWIALAEAQTACGEFEIAGETLQKAVQASAGDGRVHMARANWLRSNGQLSLALDHIRIAVGMQPDQSEWRIEQAEILRDLGQVDEALPELRAALAAQPGNWRAQEALALTYELKGELPSAAHVLRRLPADIGPTSKLNAGRILIKSAEAGAPEQIRAATELLVAARQEGLDDSSLWYWLALAYERAGLVAQSVESFQAFLDAEAGNRHPLKLDGFVGFARTAIESDQVQRALDMLEAALREFPTSHRVLFTLAKTYLASDRSLEAEQIARQAVELEPGSVESLQVLRDAMLAQDKLADAISLQEKIIACNPSDIDSIRTLAEIEHAGELVEQARSHLAQAVALGRSSAPELLKLSKTAHLFGHARLAHRLLKQAVRIEPENEAGLLLLAESSESISDLETAQSSWLRYAGLRKQDPVPLERAAQALWNLGRRSAAVGLRERALEISDTAEQHLALAETLRFLGQTGRSTDHYRLAAEKAGGDPSLLVPISEALYELGQLDHAGHILAQAGAGNDSGSDISLLRARYALDRDDLETASRQVKIAKEASRQSSMLSSLEVQIARSKGQLDASEREFNALMSGQVESERECDAAVRAALSLNAWQEAVSLIRNYLERHPFSDRTAQSILILSHRMRDLEWLYAIACEAPNHAPMKSAEGLEELEQRIAKTPGGIAPSTQVLIDTWEAIQNGDTSREAMERIHAAPTSIQPMLLEAGMIALLKANRPARALELAETAGITAVCHARCGLLRGVAETMLKHFDAAIESLNRAAADPLLQPLSLYLQSESYRKSDRPSESLSALNAALALWPEESSWHFRLSQHYLETGHVDAALPHLQQAVEIEPANGEFLIALARAYRQVGQMKDALGCFARGLQYAPKSGAIWKEAGAVALDAGDLDSAEAWLERACTLAPSDAICAIQSARAALARGDLKAAMKRGQAAVRMQPDHAEVLSGMGEILAADGKIDKAIQMYDMALKSAEDNLEIRLARGSLLAKSGRSGEAAAELESIVKAAPEHDHAWANLAQARIESGDLEQALQAANQALKLSPRNIQYMLLIGKVCRMNGQLDRALSVLSEATRLAPEEADVARELGKAHELRREHTAALDAYQRALDLRPDDIESLIEAGLILKTIKVYDQAGELFERAVKLNPVDPQALQQLATIRALQLIHGSSQETEAVPS